MMHKSFIKILSILFIIGLNWAGLSAIGRTFAYFNDTENSSENIFSAATLDFSITNTNIKELIGVELGEDIEFISVLTKMAGSLDIQYKAYAEKISGNDDFCNALQLEAFHSSISYDGDLLSFDTGTTTILGTWAFEIKLPHTASNFSHGEECNIDLVFKGWRQDVADFNQSGFTDEERIELRLTSRMIVLNEFLPRPDDWAYGFDFGNDSSDMPQGEWVELYNNSDFAFDLSEWYIKDSLESDTNKIMITGSNTVPAGTIINPKSWLVVYMNKAVLDNTGDTVRLFDSANVLIDSYAYTGHDYCELEPTPGDENSDTTGSGSCGLVPPNKSYARIPDGIGYWVDPIPTPGSMNKLEGDIIEIENEEKLTDIEATTIEELATTSEDMATTTEEVSTTTENQDGGIIEEINEIIDEIVDAIMPDEETGEEVVLEPEVPVIEDTSIIEEASGEMVEEQIIEEESTTTEENNEEIIINEPAVNEPAIEQEPVVVPENPESNNSNPEGGGDASTNEGSGDTTETPAE